MFSYVFKSQCIPCTHARTHTRREGHILGQWDWRKDFQKEKGFRGRLERIDRGRMMDRNKELGSRQLESGKRKCCWPLDLLGRMVFWTLGCLQKSRAARKECKGVEVLKDRWPDEKWYWTVRKNGFLNSRVCRKAELPGRSVKVKKFWKVDGGLMRNYLKAKKRRLVLNPLLSRYPVKRMKHRSDVGEFGCSENELQHFSIPFGV